MPNLCINLKTIHYSYFSTTILRIWIRYIHKTLDNKNKTNIFFQDLAQILAKIHYITLGCKRSQKFHKKSKIYHISIGFKKKLKKHLLNAYEISISVD